jgi:ERCC4-type nuclease
VVIFRSPTEQNPAFKNFKISSLCEQRGSDFLFPVTELGFVGIQRKAIRDLVASLRDGRLAKEIGQMEGLGMKVLILEGKNNWTRDGESTLVNGWSETQQTGVIFSMFLKNFLVLETVDHLHTSRSILQLQKYLAKSNHSSLDRRPKAVGTWGKADSKEFAIHVLQSFPGVGVDLARRIYDRFGLPLQWTVDVLDLQQLDGIGVKKAAQIIGALHAARR